MGTGSSISAAQYPRVYPSARAAAQWYLTEPQLRNGANDQIWKAAHSEATMLARRNLESTIAPFGEEESFSDEHDANTDPLVEKMPRARGLMATDTSSVASPPRPRSVQLCRIGYSSVLVASSAAVAQAWLATIFTQALQHNSANGIGGALFFDETTCALVQVIEGPKEAVRRLYERVKRDPRHTAVVKLFDVSVKRRHFERFGMMPGSSEAIGSAASNDVRSFVGRDADADERLLRLTYISQLNAESAPVAYHLVRAVLRVAIARNIELGIGGAIFLHPTSFRVLQVTREGGC